MKAPGKIVSVYAATALTWILFSDQALHFAAQGGEEFVTLWQSIKGFLFVVVTSFVLYLVLRFYLRRLEQAQREKRQVFESTVDTSAHIINSFLNDMIWFRMVAEDSPFIDRDLLVDYDARIRRTADQLNRLAALEEVSPREIRAWLEQDEGHYYCPLPEDEPAPPADSNQLS